MKNIFLLIFLFIISFTVFSCGDEENFENPIEIPEAIYDPQPYNLDLAIHFPDPNLPEDNPLTVDGVQLGRMLFYEPLLSKNNTVSCASCHKQENAFSDVRKLSIGVHGDSSRRQSMPIFNMALNRTGFFWDGKMPTLRSQSLIPIEDPIEMDETLENVVKKLEDRELYRNQFYRAFGDFEINSSKISLALEQFMLSIVSDNTKFDRFLLGQDTLTASEQRGMALFNAEYNQFLPEVSGADCLHCHSGFNMENKFFSNNGLEDESSYKDLGRFNITGDPTDKGKFKIPSLRNIELTPPYMHDGRFSSLEEALEHYNSNVKVSPTLDPAILHTTNTGLNLSDNDKADIIAFLKTLTDWEMIKNPKYSNPFEWFLKSQI